MSLTQLALALSRLALAQADPAADQPPAESTQPAADAESAATTDAAGEPAPDPIRSVEDAANWIADNTDLIIAYTVKAVGALLILLIGYIIAAWLSRLTLSAMGRAKLDITLGKFFAKLVRWGVLALVFLGVLGFFGVETASFAVVLGAAGLAIGLAFQGTLSNFASGVMLLTFRPFKVGDVVNAGGVLGKVDEIELFTTRIDTFDNRRFILPNSSIFGATIENISHHPIRRVDVNVGVAYDADIDQTREVLRSAIDSLDTVLADPEPAVALLELGGSSVDWVCRAWVNAADFWPTKDALTRAVKMKLDAADISIPFPQMDVHLNGELRGLNST